METVPDTNCGRLAAQLLSTKKLFTSPRPEFKLNSQLASLKIPKNTLLLMCMLEPKSCWYEFTICLEDPC